MPLTFQESIQGIVLALSTVDARVIVFSSHKNT